MTGRVYIRALAIVQTDNHHLFCEDPGVDFRIEQAGDQNYFTGAIKFGEHFDLLNISQTPELLEKGIVDPTDVIDPAMELTEVHYKIGNVIVSEKTTNQPGSMFIASMTGNYRIMMIQWENEDTRVYGTVNMETGHTWINATSKKEGVEPLAFRIKAFRTNSNRTGKFKADL